MQQNRDIPRSTISTPCKTKGCREVIHLGLQEQELWTYEKYKEFQKGGYEKELSCEQGHKHKYTERDFSYPRVFIIESK